MNKLTLILLAFLTLGLKAQEIETLTLNEAINYALENKAEAKKAKQSIENSEYQIQEARSRALPQISINSGITYNPILQTTVIDGSTFGSPGIIQAALGQKWSSNAGVSLTQNIFDQAVFIGLKAAKTTREFYQINNQLTEEQVIESVANSYYQVYVLRQRAALVDSNLVTTVKVRDIIKGQYDNGLAKQIDLDRMNVNLSNIETQKLQLTNAIQLQENALKFFIGMPIENSIEIPETEFTVSLTDKRDSVSIYNRSEYKLLKKQEELLTLQKKSISASYYPTLSLSANYSYLGQGDQQPWFAKPADGVYWSDFSAIGLTLRIPIFTGFGTKARVSQSNIQLSMLQEDIKDTKLKLDLDYENASTQINNSIATLQSQKKNMELAEKIKNNINNNYLQGLASLTDLLDAENASTEAQNNYTSAILDYKLAEIQLLKSKGELKTLINQ